MRPENPHWLRSQGSQPSDGNPQQIEEAEDSEGEDSLSVQQEEILENLDLAEEEPVARAEPTNNTRMNFANVVKLAPFAGNPGESPEQWLSYFDRYARANGIEGNFVDLFPFYLTTHAKVWFESLKPDVQGNREALRKQFVERFKGNGATSDIWSLAQLPEESCGDFYTRFVRLASTVDLAEEAKINLLTRGLRPKIRTMVIMKDPKSLEDARQAMLLAERTFQPEVSHISDRDLVSEVIRQLQAMDMLPNQEPERKPYGATVLAASQFQPRRPFQPKPSQHGYQPAIQKKESSEGPSCHRCGEKGKSFIHPLRDCPAKTCLCNFCGLTGHYPHLCKNRDGRKNFNKNK